MMNLDLLVYVYLLFGVAVIDTVLVVLAERQTNRFRRAVYDFCVSTARTNSESVRGILRVLRLRGLKEEDIEELHRLLDEITTPWWKAALVFGPPPPKTGERRPPWAGWIWLVAGAEVVRRIGSWMLARLGWIVMYPVWVHVSDVRGGRLMPTDRITLRLQGTATPVELHGELFSVSDQCLFVTGYAGDPAELANDNLDRYVVDDNRVGDRRVAGTWKFHRAVAYHIWEFRRVPPHSGEASPGSSAGAGAGTTRPDTGSSDKGET